MRHPKLDWQIGEQEWEDNKPSATPADLVFGDDAVEETPTATAPGRARLRWLPIALVILGLAGLIALLLIGQRVDDATQSARQSVLAAHELMSRAATQSDAELFDSLLATGTYGWRQAQQDLFEQGALFDREALGLQARPGDPRLVDVILSPDLKQAQVVTEHTYTVDGIDGTSETVRLWHTSVFRLKNQRWQLAPPEDEFWGKWNTRQGERLTLVYPERDEEIGRRLAHDLEAVMGDLCAELADIGCLHTWNLQLRLEREPRGLVDILKQQPALATPGNFNLGTNALSMGLPTPTLVGAPVDEAGYQALYRAYAQSLVHAIMNRLAMQNQSLLWQDPRLYDAAVNRELVRLGLRAWPVATDSDPAPPPISPPDHDIVFSCIEGTSQGSLYRYDPAAHTWAKAPVDRIISRMYALPDRSGLILHQQTSLTDDASERIVLWRNGTQRVLYENTQDSAARYLSAGIDPSGRYLMMYSVSNSYSTATRYSLLDLEGCGPSGCDVTDLPGWAIWSPDGSHTIVWVPESAPDTLYLGDSRGEPLKQIGAGESPFWLDDETYAYARATYAARTGASYEVVIATIADGEVQVLVTREDLTASLPEDEVPNDLAFGIAQVNPSDPDLLIIWAFSYDRFGFSPSGAPQYSYLAFLFDRRTRQASPLLQTPGFWSIAHFSPDGRWIVTWDSDPTKPVSTLTLRAVEGQATETLTWQRPRDLRSSESPIYGWSADGRWLAVFDGGVLHLFVPGYDYQRTITPESPGCSSVAAVNR